MTYNPLERKVAALLASHPQMKERIKAFYQRLNYYIFANKSFDYIIHSKAELISPEEWFGIPSCDRPTFFGYFDKTPWSQDMEKAVFHEIRDDNLVNICVYSSNGITRIGSTPLWNYQQGAMCQWHPSRPKQVIYNDIVDGEWGARIMTDKGDEVQSINFPIQVIHPTQNKGLSLNYKRLDRIRPEYGYSEPTNVFSATQSYEKDGIWRIDLSTGETSLLITLATLRNYKPRSSMQDADHKVNHALYSPTGDRFVFMHRWIGSKGKYSRLYVADNTANKLDLLLDNQIVSHYCWINNETLLVWGRTESLKDCYFLLDTNDGSYEKFSSSKLDIYGDGHPSLSPNREWIVVDTYPDRERQRSLLLIPRDGSAIIEVGRFFAPLKYSGEKRCDHHPRWSPDGSMISIDSAHSGERKSYFLNIDSIINDR